MIDIARPFVTAPLDGEDDPVAKMTGLGKALHFGAALPFKCLPRWLRYGLGPIIGVGWIAFGPWDMTIFLAIIWTVWAVLIGLRRPTPRFEPYETPVGRVDAIIVALAPPLMFFGEFFWVVNVTGFQPYGASAVRAELSEGGFVIVIWTLVAGAFFKRDPVLRERTSFGSARFLSDLDRFMGAEGLLIGRAGETLPKDFAGRILRNPDPRHMVTVAANGAGKGVSAIVPNLLAYEGSVLAIDPKGELAAITARRREARGQTVHVLDPWGLSGFPSASFNPLSILTLDNPDIAEDAALITDALVFEDGGSDPYWNLEARNMLQGLILHLATSSAFEDQDRTLLTLRELITRDQDAFADLLDEMASNPHASGAVARIAGSLQGMPEKQFGSIRSTARVSTDFLESPRMGRVLSRTDFDLADLKRHKTTVYLCLPAGRLGTHARWLRLMIGLALEAMERERVKPKRPVVFLMDEFATLGYMRSIENAIGQIRGFGVQLWVVLQDLNQLKALYRDRWETFLGNAGTVQFFGLNDHFTTQYVSRVLGEQTILVTSENKINQSRATFSISEKGRSLMTADEVRRLPAGQQIILMQGQPGLVADKLCYFADSEFDDLYDQNPLL
ncbi:MAG: type IV secretory system conjugative DNA transfer family protein [Erythrobacter sp.]|nr:type IV secretory system conjugative DNA transfer family protein [Erythrobacter sp.]